MEKILVVLPVDEAMKKEFENAVSGRAELVFSNPASVTEKTLEGVSIVVGNIAPALLKNSKVKLLQLNSAGFEAYTVKGVMPEGSKLCNATGAYGLTVSEHMVAMTFSLIRHLHLYRDKQKAHDWSDCGNIISIEGSTIAVLGLGDIGGDYARKVKALGASKVYGFRRSLKNKPDYIDEQYTMDKLDEILPEVDILAMVLPGGDETRDLINKDTLARMKKGSYIVNCGRGTSVDQKALLEAIRSGHIAGAALDVTNPEPLPKDSELYDEPRVLLTPHVAGNFFLRETLMRVVRIALKNIDGYFTAKPLVNEIKH